MAPALRIPVSLSMDQFQQQASELGNVTSSVVRKMATEFAKLNAEIAVNGVKALTKFGLEIAKTTAATMALQAALRVAMRIAFPLLAITAVVEAFRAMAAISELAKEKIAEFNEVQKQAFAAGVSTEFFQRWVKGGEAMKLSIDDATAALQRFADRSKDVLGGSELSKRIAELQEAGNLKGNTGVGAVGAATDTEGKALATIKLIREALDAGERLVALDIADKFFGPKVTEHLRNNSGYLDQIEQAMRNISATKLIDQDAINQAVDLKNRLDEAQRVLAEKWKPIQQDLTKLGMEYQESWVNFYQNLASAVGYANQLYDALKRVPEVLAAAGSSPFWTKFTDFTGRMGLNSELPENMKLTPGNLAGPQSPAVAALASGLRNPAAIEAAQGQATAIQTRLRGDPSKAPGAKAVDETTDAYERQYDQLLKNIEVQEASNKTIGKTVDVQEAARVTTLLEHAAMKEGIVITQEYRDEIDRLAARAGAAALKQAELAASIQKFNSAMQTIGSAISTAFTDAIVEGKSLNDVFKSLIVTLEKAAINAAIMSIFTPGAGGGKSPIAQFLGFAGGTDFAPGGPAIVGERGPELVNLPRGAQVIPNDVLRSSSLGSSNSIFYSPAIDARGASVEAVARLAQILEADRASFASRTVATIQQARRGRVPGL